MLHSLKHYRVLHERMVLVTIRVFDVPYVPEIDRVEVAGLGEAFWRVTVHYGFLKGMSPTCPQPCRPAPTSGSNSR